jgi:hypothetical protein
MNHRLNVKDVYYHLLFHLLSRYDHDELFSPLESFYDAFVDYITNRTKRIILIRYLNKRRLYGTNKECSIDIVDTTSGMNGIKPICSKEREKGLSSDVYNPPMYKN